VIAVVAVGSFYGYLGAALVGALVASAVVYVLGSAGRGGATPVKLALAGVAITALLSSLTSGLTLGVVTGVLGAPFLLWRLTRANRVGSGG
jgi:iron complex transport system permease protein